MLRLGIRGYLGRNPWLKQSLNTFSQDETRCLSASVLVSSSKEITTVNRLALLATLLVLGIVLAPLILYLKVFGTTLSTEHTRWAEFGSAIGGIYAPVAALLTLVVLLVQVTLQKQFNRHEYQHAFLEQARTDIEFYSVQMASVMNSIALPGKTLRAVLHENFQVSNVEELDSVPLRQLAANIHALIPQSFDIWGATYPILVGLAAAKGQMFNLTHGSSIQKLVALLSFETCVALDNFHRTRTEGRVSVEYNFSPLLSKQ
jgi:hypothetical protein